MMNHKLCPRCGAPDENPYDSKRKKVYACGTTYDKATGTLAYGLLCIIRKQVDTVLLSEAQRIMNAIFGPTQGASA